MKAKAKKDIQENNLTSSQIEQSIKSYPRFPRLPRTGGNGENQKGEKIKIWKKERKRIKGLLYDHVWPVSFIQGRMRPR